MGNLKLFIQLAGYLLFAIFFSSCTQFITTEYETATVVSENKEIIPASTQTSVPYPILTDTPDSVLPIATKQNEQIYIDPEGWYSINLPSEWKENETPGSYSEENGFFETEYLPEMEFMQHPVNICHWLANVDSKLVYSIQAPTLLSDKARNCTLTSLPGIMPATIQSIIENPSADYEHRFFYIKTDVEHYNESTSTFTWLKPVDRYGIPFFELKPSRPEDSAFWENTASVPTEFSISEYELLPEGQNESPSRKIFLNFIPSGVPPKSKTEDYVDVSNSKLSINELGYELTGKPPNQQLNKDGELLFENVNHISNVYAFSTTSDLIWSFIVTTVEVEQSGSPSFNSYLVENDNVIERGYYHLDPPLSPILYKGELLWVRVDENFYALVQNSNQDVLFSFATYFGARVPINRFTSWDDHWILEIGSYVIQDGEIFNAKYGFEETFDWRLINNKPFYFFRKGQRVGISYDGELFPINYHNVAHGFCCGLMANNPWKTGNSIQFFGQRDSVWYYVIVEFN